MPFFNGADGNIVWSFVASDDTDTLMLGVNANNGDAVDKSFCGFTTVYIKFRKCKSCVNFFPSNRGSGNAVVVWGGKDKGFECFNGAFLRMFLIRRNRRTQRKNTAKEGSEKPAFHLKIQ